MILPISFTIICAFLVVVPIITTPQETLIGLGFLVSGVPAYILGVKWRSKPKAFNTFMGRFSTRGL